jgi:hypothetical protein
MVLGVKYVHFTEKSSFAINLHFSVFQKSVFAVFSIIFCVYSYNNYFG